MKVAREIPLFYYMDAGRGAEGARCCTSTETLRLKDCDWTDL